jgi:hypothetical protein
MIRHEFIINPFSEGNGIILRSITKIFSDIETNQIKFTVSCSFLQLYNEKIYDLLDVSIIIYCTRILQMNPKNRMIL